MSTLEQNKAVCHRIADLLNAHDIDAAFALASPDLIEHSLPPGTPPGPEPVRQFFRAQLAAFPDMRASLGEMIAEGDKVAYRIEVEGTHQGPLMGIPPTGKRVKWSIINIDRIVDGQLVEHWSEMDTMGLMQQLGVVPPPRSA